MLCPGPSTFILLRLPTSPVSSTSARFLVDEIKAALASSDFYAFPDIFQQPSNQQTKRVIFAQLGWDCLLVIVNIHSLHTTVTFLKESKTVYLKLALAVKLYYKSTSMLIANLPTFTAQAVLSTGKMGSQLFKPLQERSTLKKYSQLMALFLVFLFHHTADPTSHFPIPFHPDHQAHLESV